MTKTTLKSPAEIALMDEANRIIRMILVDLRAFVRPGVSTLDVDRFAEERIRAAGGVPAFKVYPHRHDGHDFPGTVCASLNDEVVHGVPRASVVLREPGGHWHDYGKSAREGRKVGHATLRADTTEALVETLQRAGAALGRESQVVPVIKALR